MRLCRDGPPSYDPGPMRELVGCGIERAAGASLPLCRGETCRSLRRAQTVSAGDTPTQGLGKDRGEESGETPSRALDTPSGNTPASVLGWRSPCGRLRISTADSVVSKGMPASLDAHQLLLTITNTFV